MSDESRNSNSSLITHHLSLLKALQVFDACAGVEQDDVLLATHIAALDQLLEIRQAGFMELAPRSELHLSIHFLFRFHRRRE